VTPLQRYIAEEIATDHLDGLLSRREALRRLALLGIGATAASALIASCGSKRPPAQAGSTQPVQADATPAPGTPPGMDAALPTEPITWAGPRGQLQGGWAAARDPRGAVLVIHENKGLNDWVRSVAGRLAGIGYSALAIDLLAEEGGTATFDDPAKATAALAGVTPDQLVSTFIARRVDGLIIAPAGNDHSFIASQARAGLPVVFVDRPGSTAGFDAVVSDNEEGARVGVAHLIAHGHTRIAFIGDLPQIPTAELRYRGYLDAHAAAGLDVDDVLVVRGVHEPGAGTAAVASLFALPSPPTAIFSAQNIITIEVVKARKAPKAKMTTKTSRGFQGGTGGFPTGYTRSRVG